jgi:hypothetical protein
MSLSAEATRVFEHLPADGTKVGGITLQRELDLSKVEYQRARDELKAEGLVVPGAGRGGSLEGAQPQEERVVSKSERMAHAREAKSANSRERKVIQDLREKVLRFVHEEGHKQVEEKHISFTGMDYEKPIIEVWKGGMAQIYTIKPLEWSQLRAERRGDV